MEDFSIWQKNWFLLNKWSSSILSFIGKSKLLTFTTTIAIAILIAFSSPFASVYVLNRIIDENAVHHINVAEQRENAHNMYIVDLIDACVQSHQLDPKNSANYCKKAKEYYFYKAQADTLLKDNVDQVVADDLFLVMKADIQFLINQQSVNSVSRQFPKYDLPDVKFVFTAWFLFLSYLLAVLCAWAFYRFITNRHNNSEEQT
ncbi:hypothetical protein [Aliivibrio fischeri]|uniref:Uncharacterized protein n=1 Tax=Aliivibrio fischeri TaxID=668 RepID=A0A844P3H8_ALIFS|nr:hypothetical protein [Aliivibrio fischeri]MUK49961.1 hypothetical protein [Aliivibrio fischeri]